MCLRHVDFFPQHIPHTMPKIRLFHCMALIFTEQKKKNDWRRMIIVQIIWIAACVFWICDYIHFSKLNSLCFCVLILLKKKKSRKKRFRTCVRMCVCACVEIALNLLSIYLCFTFHDCFVFVLTSPMVNISIMPQIANEKSGLR